MIRLKRARDTDSLERGFTGEGLQRKLAKLVQARLDYGKEIPWEGVLGDWKKMKPELQKESFDKCAYCDSPTAGVAWGDVEHFRPKSVYWWLALCVDNYVYACQICNQGFKGDKFPIKGKKLRAPLVPATLPADPAKLKKLLGTICPDPAMVNETQLLKKWFAEDADLPHPYLEDPEALFAWTPIDTIEEVLLIVPDNATARAKRAFKSAEANLGLNRDVLRRTRYTVFDSLRYAVEDFKDGDEVRRMRGLLKVQRMCRGNQPFAGMCRYFAFLANVPVDRSL